MKFMIAKKYILATKKCTFSANIKKYEGTQELICSDL